MQRERLADDIYVFTSDLYVQVTAGLVVSQNEAVLIDTLAYPEETLQIKRFVENRLGAKVRYVINTHFHADHTTGTCFFPEARVVAHRLCRELIDGRGRESLEQAKALSTDLRDVEIVLPQIVFDTGELSLHIGTKTLRLFHAPGHSPDGIVCHLPEQDILFAGDILMPIPYFVDGNFDDFLASLYRLRTDTYENIVQGHGEIILPGEIEAKLQSDIDYLLALRSAVDAALESRNPDPKLAAIDIESCGKSRILLNGIAETLHRRNISALTRARREPTI